LQAGARAINLQMKLAAARAIADHATGDELVPDALNQHVHDAVAKAVREAAEESGVARPELATAGL
jgi:malate dehydrogenase (oxaloacetate-decarboxylating)